MTRARTIQAPAPPSAANAEAWPHFGEDEIEAVAEVLRSGKVNQWTGDRVKAFEAAMARLIGVPHAVAVANGTLGLELALRALGIGTGDEVIVTSRSFLASAGCVRTVGAIPVFADVDANSQNISAATVAPLITSKTKAILPVHLAGWPVDMPPLMTVAAEYDLVVIEDCAQSIGAAAGGTMTGAHGHAAVFSFCQDKIVTTGGEGGMVLFQDSSAWQRAWEYKDHGKSWSRMQEKPQGPGFRYVHGGPGSNWRLTEMQAAIGLVQLTKLERWIGARSRNAGIWRAALAGSSLLRIPEPAADIRHAWYKFYCFLRPETLRAGTSRDDVLRALIAGGVKTFSGSCPEIYREEAFADMTVEPRPVACQLGETSLMFEIHPTLDPDGLRSKAQAARRIIDSFSR
ncbi:MAG: DegT/DnrJ/EryC1/StrS family aminotransferase [Pseudomonadota bacterium]|nr:DegT/DnrJ/EryC1/StrS family aminotransferase [Pseudomonadota bacterium]